MSTLLILNIKSPDSGTPLVDAKVKLRNFENEPIAINYTNASGQVSFNVPDNNIVNVLDRAINPRLGMWLTIDGVGDTAQFTVPNSGTYTGAILFDGRPSTRAATQTFVAS